MPSLSIICSSAQAGNESPCARSPHSMTWNRCSNHARFPLVFRTPCHSGNVSDPRTGGSAVAPSLLVPCNHKVEPGGYAVWYEEKGTHISALLEILSQLVRDLSAPLWNLANFAKWFTAVLRAPAVQCCA